MKKISITKRLIIFGITATASIGLFGSLAYLTQPDRPSAAEIPVINYDNSGIGNKILIAGSRISPFAVKLPALPEVPEPPAVPAMADGYSAEDARLAVIGVLPPDVVILRKAGETVTARSGEDTKFGLVGNVGAKGAVVNGEFVELK